MKFNDSEDILQAVTVF